MTRSQVQIFNSALTTQQSIASGQDMYRRRSADHWMWERRRWHSWQQEVVLQGHLRAEAMLRLHDEQL